MLAQSDPTCKCTRESSESVTRRQTHNQRPPSSPAPPNDGPKRQRKRTTQKDTKRPTESNTTRKRTGVGSGNGSGVRSGAGMIGSEPAVSFPRRNGEHSGSEQEESPMINPVSSFSEQHALQSVAVLTHSDPTCKYTRESSKPVTRRETHNQRPPSSPAPSSDGPKRRHKRTTPRDQPNPTRPENVPAPDPRPKQPPTRADPRRAHISSFPCRTYVSCTNKRDRCVRRRKTTQSDRNRPDAIGCHRMTPEIAKDSKEQQRTARFSRIPGKVTDTNNQFDRFVEQNCRDAPGAKRKR